MVLLPDESGRDLPNLSENLETQDLQLHQHEHEHHQLHAVNSSR
jgi:hypothetical protein